MTYVLAIDAGGTATRSAIAALDGTCLGYAQAGSGNPISAGIDLALDNFRSAVATTCAQAGVAGGDVSHVRVAMAGGITSGSRPRFEAVLAGLGIREPITTEADLLGNFASGTWQTSGYGLDGGTGAGAIRVSDGQIVRVADALGWLVGDAGSGYQLGVGAVRAAFADLDGRGPATTLTDVVLRDLGVERGDGPPMDFGRSGVLSTAVRRVYERRPIVLARFAEAVFASRGDAVADELLRQAARDLAWSLRVVAAPDVSGPVVFAGSVLTRNRWFMDEVAGLVADVLPAADNYLVAEDGMVGVIILALRAVGVEVGETVLCHVATTLASMRSRSSDARMLP